MINYDELAVYIVENMRSIRLHAIGLGATQLVSEAAEDILEAYHGAMAYETPAKVAELQIAVNRYKSLIAQQIG